MFGIEINFKTSDPNDRWRWVLLERHRTRTARDKRLERLKLAGFEVREAQQQREGEL